jgi:hypothetical protein
MGTVFGMLAAQKCDRQEHQNESHRNEFFVFEYTLHFVTAQNG